MRLPPFPSVCASPGPHASVLWPWASGRPALCLDMPPGLSHPLPSVLVPGSPHPKVRAEGPSSLGLKTFMCLPSSQVATPGASGPLGALSYGMEWPGVPTSALRLSSVPAPSSLLFEPMCCYVVGLMEAPLCTPFPKPPADQACPTLRMMVNS